MTTSTWVKGLCAAVVLALATPVGAFCQPAPRGPGPVAAGANAFAVDFYHALRERPGNLFFSPFNISTAFSMAASGARGETAAEMRKVFHLPASADATDAETGRLLRAMAVKQEGLQLHFANAIWVADALPLKAGYERSMTANYDSGVQRIDFGGPARETINAWVASKTADRIKDLLPSRPDGPMVITSAVYMKADWADPFDKSDTREGDFRPTGAAPVRAPLMTETKFMRHLDGGAFQAVTLPYSGERQSMVVFLPKQADGLAAFEKGLTAEKLEDWLRRLDQAEPQRVLVTLPKYKVEDEFKMKALLIPMGMRRAFGATADFSGISDSDLMIDEARHKSFVAVDEEGTEAAAATAIELVITSSVIGAPPPIIFRADHPFLFLVRDNASGALLFIGRLASPPA